MLNEVISLMAQAAVEAGNESGVGMPVSSEGTANAPGASSPPPRPQASSAETNISGTKFCSDDSAGGSPGSSSSTSSSSNSAQSFDSSIDQAVKMLADGVKGLDVNSVTGQSIDPLQQLFGGGMN